MKISCFLLLILIAGFSSVALRAQTPTPPETPAIETIPPEPAESGAEPGPASPSPSTPVAPPAPTAQAPTESNTAAPAPSDPAPSDEFSQKVLPPVPTKKPIPTSSGDRSGPVYLGHRAVIDRYAGWGWIKKENEPWSRARWVMIEETIGKSVAPGRHYSRPTEDDGITYRMFGTFADYKGYEPNYDVFVDVFRISGWEKVGPEPRPKLRPPRGSTGGQSRFSERGANLRR